MRTTMAMANKRPGGRIALLLALLLIALGAQAQTRAWLDRDRIAVGETATLNIETNQATVPSPDYAPLLAEFSMSGNTSSRQFESINGQSSVRVLFAVALRPKRDGLLRIPALRVGAQSTQPLTLTVTPAAPGPAAGRAGGVAFIEAESDAQDPYVQQAVGYTVRLYYAMPLIAGQLDQPAPDGASLQRVGQDLQYSRDVGGRPYTVVERRFLLVPEHSGTLTIPGATFEGRGAGGFFDEMFGDGQRDLRANGAPRFLRVRAAPVDAPQPWLPLRALSLRYLVTPQSARAGDAATVTVEATADGASGAQMPELQLQVGDGAQMFAEPAQTDETFENGRPQVKVTRRFSIVPAREGALRVPGPRLAWWDVRAGIARTASLPDLNLQVARGTNGFGAAPAASAVPGRNASAPGAQEDDDWIRVPGVQGPVRPWALGTVIFAALWLVTLAWGLHRRDDASVAKAPGDLPAGPLPAGSPTLRELRQVLDTGDLADVADALCAMARPPVADLDALCARLDDPAQVAAVGQLQRARWADGDGSTARASLRQAFKSGPRWRHGDIEAKEPLAPLYPRS